MLWGRMRVGRDNVADHLAEVNPHINVSSNCHMVYQSFSFISGDIRGNCFIRKC